MSRREEHYESIGFAYQRKIAEAYAYLRSQGRTDEEILNILARNAVQKLLMDAATGAAIGLSMALIFAALPLAVAPISVQKGLAEVAHLAPELSMAPDVWDVDPEGVDYERDPYDTSGDLDVDPYGGTYGVDLDAGALEAVKSMTYYDIDGSALSDADMDELLTVQGVPERTWRGSTRSVKSALLYGLVRSGVGAVIYGIAYALRVKSVGGAGKTDQQLVDEAEYRRLRNLRLQQQIDEGNLPEEAEEVPTVAETQVEYGSQFDKIFNTLTKDLGYEPDEAVSLANQVLSGAIKMSELGADWYDEEEQGETVSLSDLIELGYLGDVDTGEGPIYGEDAYNAQSEYTDINADDDPSSGSEASGNGALEPQYGSARPAYYRQSAVNSFPKSISQFNEGENDMGYGYRRRSSYGSRGGSPTKGRDGKWRWSSGAVVNQGRSSGGFRRRRY